MLFASLIITTLCMDLGMTAFAKRNQIVSVMGSTFRQWFLMMNLIYRNDDPFLKAQLTKRMGLNIAVTDSFPCPSVPAAYSFISAILLVGTVGLLLMFLTVPTVR
jgi:hypothetical protein